MVFFVIFDYNSNFINLSKAMRGLILFISVGTADRQFANISPSLGVMKSIGWMSNLPEDPGTEVDAECKKEYGFAGYHCCPRQGGHLNAVFKGSGSAMLTYGNCGKDGYVWVSINEKEINRCTKGMKNVATFSYKKGDILRIQEFKGVIKIYSFDLHISSMKKYCNNKNITIIKLIGNGCKMQCNRFLYFGQSELLVPVLNMRTMMDSETVRNQWKHMKRKTLYVM